MASVLIIEDDRDTREMLRLFLEGEGYIVEEAPDAMTGYGGLLASPVPLVVLVDQRLPVINGCDLLNRVERDQTLRRHAYIFVTAGRPRDVQEYCDELPERVCETTLFKPFKMNDLLAAVAKAEQHLGKRT
jgi:CheY-like chemotaxis protein